MKQNEILASIAAAAAALKQLNPAGTNPEGTNLLSEQIRSVADIHDLPIGDGEDLSHDPTAVAIGIAAYIPEAMNDANYQRACDAIEHTFEQLAQLQEAA